MFLKSMSITFMKWNITASSALNILYIFNSKKIRTSISSYLMIFRDKTNLSEDLRY